MLELPLPEPARGVAELERPQEVAGLLEVGADGEDLVDQILHADDSELAKAPLDDGIVGERDALLINLTVAALVDELPDGFEGRIAVGDERFHDLEHLGGGLGQANEDAVVDLKEAKKLEDLTRLRGDFVDTVKAVSGLMSLKSRRPTP